MSTKKSKSPVINPTSNKAHDSTSSPKSQLGSNKPSSTKKTVKMSPSLSPIKKISTTTKKSIVKSKLDNSEQTKTPSKSSRIAALQKSQPTNVEDAKASQMDPNSTATNEVPTTEEKLASQPIENIESISKPTEAPPKAEKKPYRVLNIDDIISRPPAMIRYSTLISQIYKKTHHQLHHFHCQRMTQSELRALADAYIEQLKKDVEKEAEEEKRMVDTYLELPEEERMEKDIPDLDSQREDTPPHHNDCRCGKCKRLKGVGTKVTLDSSVTEKTGEHKGQAVVTKYSSEDECRSLETLPPQNSVHPSKLLPQENTNENVPSNESDIEIILQNDLSCKTTMTVMSQYPQQGKTEKTLIGLNKENADEISPESRLSSGGENELSDNTDNPSLIVFPGESRENDDNIMEQTEEDMLAALSVKDIPSSRAHSSDLRRREEEMQKSQLKKLRRELKRIIMRKHNKENRNWLRSHPNYIKRQYSDLRVKSIPLILAEPWKKKIMRLNIYKQAFSSLVLNLKAYDPLLFDIKKAYDDMVDYWLNEQKKARYERIRICMTKKGLRRALKGYHFRSENKQLECDMYAYYIISRTVNQDKALRIASSILNHVEQAVGDQHEKNRDLKDQMKLLDVELHKRRNKINQPFKKAEFDQFAEESRPNDRQSLNMEDSGDSGLEEELAAIDPHMDHNEDRRMVQAFAYIVCMQDIEEIERRLRLYAAKYQHVVPRRDVNAAREKLEAEELATPNLEALAEKLENEVFELREKEKALVAQLPQEEEQSESMAVETA